MRRLSSKRGCTQGACSILMMLVMEKMIISPQRRKPFIFYFFRRRIRDGRVVPSENVCHMSGIQSHIPEIVVALSDRVRVRVRQFRRRQFRLRPCISSGKYEKSHHKDVNISLPFVFSFSRGRIRDGRFVPSENVCHMSGIQSHIPEIVVALSDRVQVRVRRISGIFSPIPNIWHTFSLGMSWPSRFRPLKHLSTP